jgi:hypothetical protein
MEPVKRMLLAWLNLIFPTSTGAIQPKFRWRVEGFFFVAHIKCHRDRGFGCGGSTLVGGSDTDYSGSFL